MSTDKDRLVSALKGALSELKHQCEKGDECPTVQHGRKLLENLGES